MTNTAVFLINLDKSKDRLALCDAMLKSHNINYERIPAVYGADLTAEQISSSYSETMNKSFYKTLGIGEIGCYLSHRNVWQHIVDRNLDYAIILEDDITLGNIHPSEIISILNQLPKTWDYIKLLGKGQPNIVHSKPVSNLLNLITYKKIPTRTGAQAVSLKGAKKLLNTSQPFTRPVDVDIQYWWEKDIIVQGLWPYPFVGREGSPSEINALSIRKKSIKKPLKGIIQRIIFNILVHYHARKLFKIYR